MIDDKVEARINTVIDRFPEPHGSEIRDIWAKWTATNPEAPLHVSWSRYAAEFEEQSLLYSERRVYLRRITNELRDAETPRNNWQKIAKALAAVASAFFLFFMALTRAARAAE